MNLFRGSGLTGLAAMREVSERQVDDVDLAIVRPLLAIWRAEIDSYIRNHRLKFREDASNKSLGPVRNRIRHRVIPYLERNLGRSIRQSLWRTAAILAEEENWIDVQLPETTAVDLEVRKLRDLPIALQRRQIRKWLRAQNVAEVGFGIVERVRSLLNHHAGVAKVNLPRARHVRRREKKIFIAE
jgi:tRNA(Ile)-lysidine synthase